MTGSRSATRTAALAVLLSLARLAAEPAPPDVDQRLERVRERRTALEGELRSLRGQEKSLLGEVERLELEVRLRSEELRELQLDLEKTNAALDDTLKRVREREADIAAARPVLAARARSLYKLGELSYLRLLLSVERPSDVFQGYRFVAALARRDNDRFSRFQEDLRSLTGLREELERHSQEALALREQLQLSRRRLAANQQRKTELLTSIVEQKETRAAYLEEVQEAEGRLEAFLSGLGGTDASVPITVFKGSLPWPAPGRISLSFGRRKHPRFDTYTVQNGIEIAVSEPATGARPGEVRAVHEGRVAFANRFRGYGRMVVLDHGGKHHTLYARLDEILVQPGQRVVGGDVVGLVAGDGESASLYFEVRFQGQPQDPEDWLSASPTAAAAMIGR